MYVGIIGRIELFELRLQRVLLLYDEPQENPTDCHLK